MRLDADDYLDKNALEIMCLTLEKKKKSWLSFSRLFYC